MTQAIRRILPRRLYLSPSSKNERILSFVLRVSLFDFPTAALFVMLTALMRDSWRFPFLIHFHFNFSRFCSFTHHFSTSITLETPIFFFICESKSMTSSSDHRTANFILGVTDYPHLLLVKAAYVLFLFFCFFSLWNQTLITSSLHITAHHLMPTPLFKKKNCSEKFLLHYVILVSLYNDDLMTPYLPSFVNSNTTHGVLAFCRQTRTLTVLSHQVSRVAGATLALTAGFDHCYPLRRSEVFGS